MWWSSGRLQRSLLCACVWTAFLKAWERWATAPAVNFSKEAVEDWPVSGHWRVVQCFSARDSTELVGRRYIGCPTQSWGYVELLGVDNRLQSEVLQDGGYE